MFAFLSRLYTNVAKFLHKILHHINLKLIICKFIYHCICILILFCLFLTKLKMMKNQNGNSVILHSYKILGTYLLSKKFIYFELLWSASVHGLQTCVMHFNSSAIIMQNQIYSAIANICKGIFTFRPALTSKPFKNQIKSVTYCTKTYN